MTNILVTGASGFIGKHLVPRLIEAGHTVNQIDIKSGDVADGSTWLRIPKSKVVIHLAGTTYVPLSWKKPLDYFKSNLLGTVAALNYCREQSAHLVFLSSYLYGNPTNLPISERHKLIATNPYALSKKMAEEACQFFAESYNINVTVLRVFNVYGAGQPDNFIIPSIIRQITTDDRICVADLEPKRDYIYVSDVVEAIMKTFDNKIGFSTINIGSGISYSVSEVIQIIQDIKNTNYDVLSTKDRRKDEIMNTIADISKAKKILGWEPRYTLYEGLTETLEMNGY